MDTTSVTELRERVRGAVIEASDPDFDQARKVFNGMIDRRPRVIVQPADDADVAAAVNFARDAGLDLSIRGGGHGVPGFGTNEGGVVIDFIRMKGIRVDTHTHTVRAQAGCTWGDLDHATHAYGLHTPGGIISSTGISGLTLGGGIGYLARGLGLSCDNLVSADVVTAEGTHVTTSEKEHADLFWALRGGGGNFGVVTTLEFNLHPVDVVYGGPILYELDYSADVLRGFQEIIKSAPERLGAFAAFLLAPPLPFIPEERHGEPFVGIVTCWAGPENEGAKMLKPFYDIAPQLAKHVGPVPYPVLNSAFDPLLPPGLQHYWKANFVTELTDDAIAAHVEHGPKIPHVSSAMHIYPINGAPQRVRSDETAFAYRDASFATVIAGMWDNPADNKKNTQWVRDYYAATAPHSEGGGYINFMSADDQDRIRANYKGNYDRLVEVKRTWDPGNLFHLNQNIVP